MTHIQALPAKIRLAPVSPSKRASLWLICLAVIFIVALKPDRVGWSHFHIIGWICLVVSFFFAWHTKDTLWLNGKWEKNFWFFFVICCILFYDKIVC